MSRRVTEKNQNQGESENERAKDSEETKALFKEEDEGKDGRVEEEEKKSWSE